MPEMEVTGLWRYPVKSMLGERCQHLELDFRGVKGDRRYAVRDADGKLGSGKDSRRFRIMDIFEKQGRSGPLVFVVRQETQTNQDVLRYR